jgi:hypothetical protein
MTGKCSCEVSMDAIIIAAAYTVLILATARTLGYSINITKR